MWISKHWIPALICLPVFCGLARAGDLRMGVPFPENTKEWKVVAKFAEDLARAPEGKMDIVLVAHEKKGPGIAKKIWDGKLDGGLVTGKDLADPTLGRDALVYAVPFTFKSTGQVDYVREGLDAEIMQRLSAGSYEALAVVEFGPAYMMSSKALSTPDDWRSREIWTPAEGGFSGCLGSLGLKTAPLPSKNVLKALKDGTADTVFVPPTGAVLKRWHTEIREVFDVPFVYTYGIWIVADDSIDKLSSDQQTTLREHLSRLCEDLSTTIRSRNNKARKVLKRYEIKFITPDAVMRSQWEQWAEEVWRYVAKENKPTEEVEDKLKERLRAFDGG